ncbi:DUF6301 family protein [Actinomyces qiguomingii]|uniref:DUF6301 family protein n=1 Tax=Actinomyces qiguomingii TaxID=2057800 RepID=UPI000CA04CF4|nr:DUF6301 family protein [Actinomyces qiguomingii]
MAGSTSSEPPTNPTYERELPDGTIYRVVPPEVGVPVIRRWLEHDWPMTAQQALALRDELGWTPSPRKETLVTTNLGSGRPKDASITIIRNKLDSIHVWLSSFAPIDFDSITTALTQSMYEQYVHVFTDMYGNGVQKLNKDVQSTTWTLHSGASIRIDTIGSVISFGVNSPMANYAAAAEAELLEWEAADDGE